MLILGICGAAGSGKTETARLLGSLFNTSKNVKFAQPIYDIAPICGWNGVKDARGRTLLQNIGDVIRTYDSELFLNEWKHEVKGLNVDLLTADDVRFPSEAALVKQMCGKVVKIVGMKYNLGAQADHESEKGIPDECCDYIAFNDGTLRGLTSSLKEMIACLTS